MRARRRWLALALLAALSGGPARPGEGEPEQPEVAWLFAQAGRALRWAELAVPRPPAPDEARALRGQALFAERCAACHGPGGRGDGVLASSLPRPPRDLVAEPLRSRDRAGAVSREELYRSISAGAPEFGMPAFDALPEEDRWALVEAVLALRGRAPGQAPPLPLPARPAAVDPALGALVFAQLCAVCHGADGRGQGPVAAGLSDDRGRPCPPADLTRGPGGYRTGARAEDVVRVLLLGRAGTPMVAQLLDTPRLWAVAEHVAKLARDGQVARREAWDGFFAARRSGAQAIAGRVVEPDPVRWDPARSERFARAPQGRTGCLACHQGVAAIASGAMAEALRACSAGDPDRECALCHEGDPTAAGKLEAHRGLIGNPGSLWVTSIGLGCGKCHSDRGALTSLHGRALPEAVGGALLAVVSSQTDPTGASGRNHAYRIQRALMAQESGKVFLMTASVGLTGADRPAFTDFALDDPDGPVPSVGSRAYRELMARAEERGSLLRMDRSQAYPTVAEARALLGDDPVRAAYADTFRKDCARCHLWGEGRATLGENRSSGCSACHVLTARTGLSESDDPTVPRDRPGHALRHELTLRIPEDQCNACHTRGSMTKHSDAHQRAGLGCVDCHTSIDVHGDGNIYASIPHQLEVRCEDCHGTAEARPWELPLGFGTPAAGDGPRGTHRQDGREHVLTSRGNPRANWLREGDAVVVRSILSGARHVTPLLAGEPPRRPAAPEGAGQEPEANANPAFMDQPAPERKLSPDPCPGRRRDLPGHQRLSCSSCHGSRSLRCAPCHMTYYPGEGMQDWLASALDYDPVSLRQRDVHTPGLVDMRPLGGAGMTWGPPDLRRERSGRVSPHIPGCQVSFTLLDGEQQRRFVPNHNFRSGDYPPPVAPTLSHELALPARTCKDCHVDGERGGRVRLPGDR